MAVSTTDKEYLNADEAAEFIGYSRATLDSWRVRKKGPPYLKPSPGKGGRVHYKRSALIEWMDSHQVEPEAQQ